MKKKMLGTTNIPVKAQGIWTNFVCVECLEKEGASAEEEDIYGKPVYQETVDEQKEPFVCLICKKIWEKSKLSEETKKLMKKAFEDYVFKLKTEEGLKFSLQFYGISEQQDELFTGTFKPAIAFDYSYLVEKIEGRLNSILTTNVIVLEDEERKVCVFKLDRKGKGELYFVEE